MSLQAGPHSLTPKKWPCLQLLRVIVAGSLNQMLPGWLIFDKLSHCADTLAWCADTLALCVDTVTTSCLGRHGHSGAFSWAHVGPRAVPRPQTVATSLRRLRLWLLWTASPCHRVDNIEFTRPRPSKGSGLSSRVGPGYRTVAGSR